VSTTWPCPSPLASAIGADGATYAECVSYPAYAWIFAAVFIALRAALERPALLSCPLRSGVAIVLAVGAPLREMHEKKLHSPGGRMRQVVMRPDVDRDQSLISEAIRRRSGGCVPAS